MGITLEVSFDQLLHVLLQLSAEEKIRMADQLKAAAAAEQWQDLSHNLLDEPEIGMSEIVKEVKIVRKQRRLGSK